MPSWYFRTTVTHGTHGIPEIFVGIWVHSIDYSPDEVLLRVYVYWVIYIESSTLIDLYKPHDSSFELT